MHFFWFSMGGGTIYRHIWPSHPVKLSILMIRVIDTMHVRFICASLQLSLVQLVVAYVLPHHESFNMNHMISMFSFLNKIYIILMLKWFPNPNMDAANLLCPSQYVLLRVDFIVLEIVFDFHFNGFTVSTGLGLFLFRLLYY